MCKNGKLIQVLVSVTSVRQALASGGQSGTLGGRLLKMYDADSIKAMIDQLDKGILVISDEIGEVKKED